METQKANFIFEKPINFGKLSALSYLSYLFWQGLIKPHTSHTPSGVSIKTAKGHPFIAPTKNEQNSAAHVRKKVCMYISKSHTSMPLHTPKSNWYNAKSIRIPDVLVTYSLDMDKITTTAPCSPEGRSRKIFSGGYFFGACFIPKFQKIPLARRKACLRNPSKPYSGQP